MDTFKTLQGAALTALSALVLLNSAPALAQQGGGLAIEEITVTAQKRAESVQDVPVAVTAYNSEMLENQGIQSFSDLTKMAPSLTIQDAANKNEAPISLRGIGTYSFSIGTEPSVLVIVDDVPIARSGGAFTNLVDIERVEVLRGPQSTLFGKNASAGVINIVTKSPGNELEGSVELLATDDEEMRLSAALSGPLSDTVGLRVSGYYGDRDGYIDNIGNSPVSTEFNNSEVYGARAKLVADLSDRVYATFIAEYNEVSEDCCAAPYRFVTPGASFFGIPDTAFAAGITPSEENRTVRVNGPFVSDSTDWLASAKFDIEFGDHTFSSITGYREWEYDWLLDVDNTDDPNIVINQGGPYVTELLTQEFRLTSPGSETFEYVAGLFYGETNNDRRFSRGPIALSDWFGTADSKSISAFGQATWGLSDNWSLITGLRVQNEEISTTFDDFQAGRSCSAGCAGSDDETSTTGRLSLQYFANDDLMWFGGYSRGYKGQTYDVTSSFTQATADNPVRAEESDSFEFGVKSTLLGGRLQLNATAFYSDYTDFQAQSLVADPSGALVFQLNNVGELETQGLEIDAIALFSENFQATIGLALIDATIKDFQGADCYPFQTAAEGCVPVDPNDPNSPDAQDLSGKDLANSPDLKFNIAGDWTIPLDSLPFDGFVNFSYQWQDDVNFDLLQNPATVQDSYGIFNLSLGINDPDLRYRVTLFMNNVTDEKYVTSITSSGFYSAPVLSQQVPRGAERYAGLRLKFNF